MIMYIFNSDSFHDNSNDNIYSDNIQFIFIAFNDNRNDNRK